MTKAAFYAVVVCLLGNGFRASNASQHSGDNESDGPIVQTNLGRAQGFTQKTAQGKLVDVFLGLPYGSPPTCKNRFAPAKPAEPWEGLLSAKSTPEVCVQGNINIFKDKSFEWWRSHLPESEDCLKLNVWVPHPRKKNLAVLVWIHGGGFQNGAANLEVYDGQILASEEDIIVVSLNYRLSSLGFLYLGHPEVPGNVGLMDQTLAIRWVKDNIAHFGGDPSRITISGESAGAAAVGYQMLLRSSLGLFQRGIIQSGSVLAPWAKKSKEEQLKVSLEFAEKLDCYKPGDEGDMAKVIECLRAKSVEEIRKVNFDFPKELVPFGPVIDGTYLTTDGQGLLDQKKFCGEKSLMLGTTSGDGSVFLQALLPEVDWAHDTVFTKSHILTLIKRYLGLNNDQLANLVLFNYIDWENPENPENQRSKVVDLLTDGFVCSDNKFAEAYAANGNHVYKYFFEHGPVEKSHPKWIKSLHGDEIPFQFGLPLDPSNGFSLEEVELSRAVMRYWANFVKHGDPNAGPGDLSKWPRYTASKKGYLLLGPGPRARYSHRRRECHFWDHVFPGIKSLAPK